MSWKWIAVYIRLSKFLQPQQCQAPVQWACSAWERLRLQIPILTCRRYGIKFVGSSSTDIRFTEQSRLLPGHAIVRQGMLNVMEGPPVDLLYVSVCVPSCTLCMTSCEPFLIYRAFDPFPCACKSCWHIVSSSLWATCKSCFPASCKQKQHWLRNLPNEQFVSTLYHTYDPWEVSLLLHNTVASR